MELNYSEAQVMLRDSARRFLAGEYAGKQHAGIWRNFADLGWLALPFAEASGGLGGGAADTALLMEEFGAALVTEPYVPTVLLAGALIERFSAAPAAMLAEICAGETFFAFAHAETAGRNGQVPIATTARRAAGGWRLEGRKTAVPGGGLVGTYIVSARIAGKAEDRDGIGLFIVPADAPGLDVLGYNAVDGRAFADIVFSGTVLGADALLTDDPATLDGIDAVLDNALVASCADALGALSVLVDETVAYAKIRVQFGKPIGSFQALQHRMADMAVMREEARAAVLLGVLKADAPPPERARAASGAKAKLGRCARFIGQQAVQIHGGMGVTEELNIGAYFKRLTVFEILFGNTEHHLRRYAALAAGTDLLSESLLSAPARLPVLQPH